MKQTEATIHPDAPRCNDSVGGIKTMQVSILQTQGNHPDTSPLVHDQVQCEILNKVVRVVVERLKKQDHQ